MTRKDLRDKGVDIVVHPILIGTGTSERKAYSFSIFDNEVELGSMEENPDFLTYEEAENEAVERSVMWVKTQLN